jgi:hypothetical protein
MYGKNLKLKLNFNPIPRTFIPPDFTKRHQKKLEIMKNACHESYLKELIMKTSIQRTTKLWIWLLATATFYKLFLFLHDNGIHTCRIRYFTRTANQM